MAIRGCSCSCSWIFGSAIGAVLLAATAPAQSVLTRLGQDNPWRAAIGDSVLAPERGTISTSANGRWVVFDSRASNLELGNTDHHSDVYLGDTTTGRCRPVGALDASLTGPNFDPAITPNGRFIVFVHQVGTASEVPVVVDRDPDLNGVFDDQVSVDSWISVDEYGYFQDGHCLEPSISDDGYRVLFLTDAQLTAYDDNGK